MKVLVTGATGFVGGHLAEALRRRGDEVTALARSPGKAAALTPLGVRVVTGDLHDRPALRQAVEGQDVIYHVAGVVAARSEADFLVANRDGTRNVLEAAVRAGNTRLVYVSSMAAAGPTIRGRPLRGDELPRPVTAYGRSKLAAEQVVTASPVRLVDRAPAHGLWAARPGGPEGLPAGPLRDRAGARRRHPGAERGARCGSGRRSRSPSARTQSPFDGPITPAIQRCSPARRWRGRSARPWEVADGAARSRDDRPRRPDGDRAAARLAGQTTILTADKANEFFQPAWTGDPAALTRDTGWRAARDLRTGLRRDLRWYRTAGWL